MVDSTLLIWAANEKGEEFLCQKNLSLPSVPVAGMVVAVNPTRKPENTKLKKSSDDTWLDDIHFLVYLVQLSCNSDGVFENAVCFVKAVSSDYDEVVWSGRNLKLGDELILTTSQLAAAGWYVG